MGKRNICMRDKLDSKGVEREKQGRVISKSKQTD